jgi:esterase/lipase superfamily enzyme
MTRLKRRILIGTALVVLAAGFLFYNAVYRSTGTALQRAEDFLFRRMTVAQLGEQGSYRFFFATNRGLDLDEGPLEERFGSEREGELTFGYFDTRIEPSVGLGMLINPSEWFQNEEIQLEAVNTLEREAFVAKLRDLVDSSPYRSLLINVNGFRERFPSALRKTAFLGHVLDINAPTLVFDWPGDQGSSLRGYRRARSIAKTSGTDLAEMLKLIIRDVRPDRLWLLANSMGGEVVVNAFSILHAEADFADAQTEIEDVVLTAPDVDHAEFDARFKQEITALARNLTVYVSSNDRALVTSRIINRSSRRGESTLDTLNPDQLEEAARVAALVDPNSDLIALVDVTPVNRTRNFHNFSLETPEFFDDLYLRLTNDQVPRSRKLYPVTTPEGATYWILTRAR